MEDNKTSLREGLTRILRDFDEILWAKLGGTVTIENGSTSYSRPATPMDNLDFVRGEWERTTEKLYELGICVDEADEPQHCEELDVPLTNLDKIRQMSAEEVAKILNNNHDLADFCKNLDECNKRLEIDEEIPDEWCVQCAKEWLERKVEE